MQARSSKKDLLDMNYYLRKSYFKTSSLICSACKSSALLSGFSESHALTVAAEEFGYHLGLAYQIVDDILDFTGASASLGKPAQADMQLGLATAPILFASEQKPELRPLIERRFKVPREFLLIFFILRVISLSYCFLSFAAEQEKGDVQKAVQLATQTNCVELSYDLAEFHAQRAVDALLRFPESDSRNALLKLLHLALSRDS
jgi:geranylgeranyl pyrophosphate synthase